MAPGCWSGALPTLTPDGLQTETVLTGSEADPLMASTTQDWAGRTVQEEQSGANGNLIRTTSFDAQGRVAVETQTGLNDLIHTYTGNLHTTTRDTGVAEDGVRTGPQS